MIRRNPDVAALVVLAILLGLGVPLERAEAGTRFGVTPAAQAVAASAGEDLARWLERFEQRKEQVWERLDRKMHEFEEKLAEREQREGLDRAERLAS